MSISDNPIIQRGITGTQVGSVMVVPGISAPKVQLIAVSPIKDPKDPASVIGSVYMGIVIDSSFVDGIKKSTGLEAAVYGDDTLSASTILSSDALSRRVGTKIIRKDIINSVLVQNQTITDSFVMGGIGYYVAFAPLLDHENTGVGMLMIGTPQAAVFTAAQRSLELTFIATAVCLLLSTIPLAIISQQIARQLH
jgi:hypothetical protein